MKTETKTDGFILTPSIHFTQCEVSYLPVSIPHTVNNLQAGSIYYYYYYIITFMQGIHTYVPETNHVSRVHSVAAIACILLMVYITLSSILNSFVLLR
jgi:hypothetical protein